MRSSFACGNRKIENVREHAPKNSEIKSGDLKRAAERL